MKKKKLYPEYSDYINEVMTDVFDFVKSSNGGNLPKKDRLILDKLADLMFLYERIKQYNDKNDLTVVNNRGVAVKSDLLKSQLEVFNQIFKISNSYGLTLRDERKLKEVDTDGDTLMNLISELNEG